MTWNLNYLLLSMFIKYIVLQADAWVAEACVHFHVGGYCWLLARASLVPESFASHAKG